MPKTTIEQISFNDQRRARSVRTGQREAISRTLAALELPTPRSLLILNGGTAEIEASLEAALELVLIDGLAGVVCDEEITAITGGTDAGIFRVFGQGLGRWGRTAPCIGVAVRSLVSWPGQPAGEASLEPHHSRFVLVDGQRLDGTEKEECARASCGRSECCTIFLAARRVVQ